MTSRLNNPDYMWKEGSLGAGVEVSIDFVPPEYEGRWLDRIHEATCKLVFSNGFNKRATLWMWGTVSVNFLHVNGVPSWSDYIVPVGLPQSFLIDLHRDLVKAFHKSARRSEKMQLIRDNGWRPIFHVDQGVAWCEVEADVWIPIATPPASL